MLYKIAIATSESNREGRPGLSGSVLCLHAWGMIILPEVLQDVADLVVYYDLSDSHITLTASWCTGYTFQLDLPSGLCSSLCVRVKEKVVLYYILWHHFYTHILQCNKLGRRFIQLSLAGVVCTQLHSMQ